ncbi:MAG: D-alanyl-D-alanine carboxypeptidase/D-alanyl-D-alanine-endopeptidase [Syntrophales bacterium]|nr:D-alanyl-D-alanine carboxypeptidase/D-alanyl-D-alanine-endopeptidase [Syntrophales bacterium]
MAIKLINRHREHLTMICKPIFGLNIFTPETKIKARKFTCPFLFFLLLSLPFSSWADEIKAILDKDIYRHAQMGMHVIDTKTGEVIYAINSDRLLYPASLTKLFVAATALSQLGRDFTFKTSLYRRGSLTATGTLQGDLIIRPGGDVFFSALNLFVQKTKAAGIKEIKGEIIVDDRLFPPYRAYSVVTPGKILYTISPATISQYQLELLITPTHPGKKARLNQTPSPGWPVLLNDVLTTKDGQNEIDVNWPKPGVLKVTGKIIANSEPIKKSVGISDPGSFLRAIFMRELQRAQIKVKASPIKPNPHNLLPSEGEDEKKFILIATHQSPPLVRYVKQILETSHNPGADALVLALGCARGGGKMEEGMKSIRDFLVGKNIPLETISLSDGAGISPANLVTPRTVTLFLHLLSQDNSFPDMLDALPLVGVSGTLKRAVTSENPIKGKIRAKTGTLNQFDVLNNSGFVQCKSLAGYVETLSGRNLAFCIIINSAHVVNLHTKTQIIKLAQEVGEDLVRIAEILYRAY